MAIIDVKNKKRGVTYVYESTSYWDKDLKQPRSKRKLLGRRDPVTNEIVPTARRAAASTGHSDTDYKIKYQQACFKLQEKDEAIRALEQELVAVKKEAAAYLKAISQTTGILNRVTQSSRSVADGR